jgi:hypothetical protein
VEKYIQGVRDVYIIGYRPSYVKNIIHIPAEDPFKRNKEANIEHKTKIACETGEISDNFLFMNDDHFFVRAIEAGDIPPYNKGDLLSDVRRREASRYEQSLKRTHDELTERGHTTYNYDIHTPIVFNKQAWLDVFKTYDWSTDGVGLVMKSTYGNTLGLGDFPLKDLKFRKAQTERWIRSRLDGRLVFSISDRSLNADMKKVLKSLHPTRSKYEIDDPWLKE